MSESTSSNLSNNGKPLWGILAGNERTIKQYGETTGNIAIGALEPLFTFLEENDYAFSGDLEKDLDKAYFEQLKMYSALGEAETKHKFNTKF